MASTGRRATRAHARGTGDNDDIDIDIDLEDDVPMRRRGRGRPSNAEREMLRQIQERHGNTSREVVPLRTRRIIDDDSESQGNVTMQDEQSRPTRTRLR